MKETKVPFVPPTQEEIAAYAHHLWESEGRQTGKDLDYWFQAEAHLTVDRQYTAGLMRRLDWLPQEAVHPPIRSFPGRVRMRAKTASRRAA